MNFYLVPGDSDEPITHLAIDASGSLGLAGTASGTLLAYGMDGSALEPVPFARRYQRIAGVVFPGSAGDAIVLGLRTTTAGDIVRMLPNRTTELLYGDAPHPFSALAFDRSGKLGLIGAGEQLLRYYPEQRSYLPVDGPLDIRLEALAFEAGAVSALAAGTVASGAGLLGRFEPGPDAGALTILAGPPLPSLRALACHPDAGSALASGPAGALVRLLPGAGPTIAASLLGKSVNAIAFHPSGRWALAATGPAATAATGAELVRIEWPSLAARTVYEGPPGAGPFTAVVFSPDGTRALAAGQWGQVVEGRGDGG